MIVENILKKYAEMDDFIVEDDSNLQPKILGH